MTLSQWIKESSVILNRDFGLDKSFAEKVALFFLYLKQYGLNPQITSGYRSPEYQRDLIARYNSGDSSIVVKPAENSKHTNTKLGKPASLAVDISTSNPALAAQIAKALNIEAGFYFQTPDRVHFYV